MAKPKYEIHDGKKKCNSCEEVKDVADFYPHKNGIRGSCKKCCNKKSRNYMQTVPKERRSEWWKRSWEKQEYRQRKYDSAQKRIKNIKQKCVDYLGGKCAVCGYNKCVEALEFHHLDPNTKDLNLKTRGIDRRKSFDSQKQELDKCILLCSNCHREKHYDE